MTKIHATEKKLTDQSSPVLFRDMTEPQDPRPLDEGEASVATKPRTALPPLYRVILLNDDFTPMEFVVQVLKKFFGKNEEDAHKIMLQVHNEGAGVAGVYSFEVAESKVFFVSEFSRRHKHPLRCTLEKES